MPVDSIVLISLTNQIQGLIEQSAAAVISASSGMRQINETLGRLPVLSRALDDQLTAMQRLNEAGARLSALNQSLQKELREHDLLGRQLAAAVEQEEGSRQAALHDPLTGLSNRVLFDDRLDHAIAQATRHEWMLAVLFVDLNEFKSVNDSYGHRAGDDLLKSVASKLARAMRREDTVSRVGGDEFLCLLTPLQEQHHIATIAVKILAAIKTPCDVAGRDGLVSVAVGGSIGISLFPKDGANVAELIRRADEAMYVAKTSKSGFAFAK